MSKYVNAADAAEKIAEKHGIRIADLCDTFGDIPAADVVPVVHGELTEHIHELLRAEQDGRLVVLPCKVGDAVYFSTHNGTICSHIIRRFERNKKSDYMCSSLWIPIDEFGKTVFLTREEAEKALEARENG